MGWVRCGLGIPSSVLSLPTPSEASGAIAQFNTDLTENLLSAVAEFSASQASGTPTPSAPIPIIGVDKVYITLCGLNLWDEEWELGLINDSDGQNIQNSSLIRSKNYIPVNPSATYYFNLATKNAHVFCYDQNKAYLGYINLVGNSTFTPLANTAFIRFRMNTAYGTTYNNDLSINYPSTDTEYHAYTGGTTALINLGGTYYGGSVDAVTGKITLTREFRVFDGTEEGWADYAGRNGFRIKIDDMKVVTSDTSGKCNMLKVTQDYNENLGILFGANNSFIYCLHITDNLSGVTDLASWKTFLSNNPLQIVYPLATPLVVYASNTAEIPTIVGDNQVFADSGDVAVKYFETVGHKI